MTAGVLVKQCLRIDSGLGVPILAPLDAASHAQSHLHSVFGENGSVLDEYRQFTAIDNSAIEHWIGLIRDAGRVINEDFHGSTVLDIGSGGGVSVFALIEVCQNGYVWASDLCLPLLYDLKHKFDNLPIMPKAELSIMQTSAESLVFGETSFDFVIGGNIIHHAYSPVKMLLEARRVLKAGGHAIFWEPCESGAQLLCLVMDVLSEISGARSCDKLNESVLMQFSAYRNFVLKVNGREHSDEFLSNADDKWMFTRSHLRDIASEAGFTVVDISNIYGYEGIIEKMMAVELKRHGQALTLPEWANEEIRRIQNRMSPDFLLESPFSCRMLLHKST